MKKAVIPGTYDPITNGHMNLIQRASDMFDEVIVAVVYNPSKNNMFSLEDRKRFAAEACKDYPNVRVEAYEGLLIDFVKMENIDVVVRGVRNARDFDYEYELAQIYFMTGDGLETVFLPSNGANAHVSSTMVRELIKHNKPCEEFIPFTMEDK